MKIAKVKKAWKTNYPTLAESVEEPRLLEHIPRRWVASQPFASLIGAGLFAHTLLAQAKGAPRAEEEKVEVMQNPDRAARSPDDAQTAQQAKQVATIVAPMLEEALANDGRGAFGCVSTAPPCYLSENEALELIQTELEKAGLNLKDVVTVKGVEAPVGYDNKENPNQLREALALALAERDAPVGNNNKVKPSWEERTLSRVKFGQTDYDFDFGDEGRSILIEYFSPRDYDKWTGGSLSTVSEYDFPKLMETVSKAFKKRVDGNRIVIGLFFDPLARAPDPIARMEGLDEDQRKFVLAQVRATWNDEELLDREYSKKKLRRQVQHFIEYLRKEGVLPKE